MYRAAATVSVLMRFNSSKTGHNLQSWTHFQAKLQIFVVLLPWQETTVTKALNLCTHLTKEKLTIKTRWVEEENISFQEYCSALTLAGKMLIFFTVASVGLHFRFVLKQRYFLLLHGIKAFSAALLHQGLAVPCKEWAGDAQGAGKGNSRDTGASQPKGYPTLYGIMLSI